mgnify:FL=1
MNVCVIALENVTLNWDASLNEEQLIMSRNTKSKIPVWYSFGGRFTNSPSYQYPTFLDKLTNGSSVQGTISIPRIIDETSHCY